MVEMQTKQEPMPVAVIGIGRMGMHHVRTYRKLPTAKLAAVVDAYAELAMDVAEEFGCHGYGTVEEMLQVHPEVRAVSVATPTRHHPEAARPLLEAGIACLVEKPLAATATEARELVALAQARHVVLQVGHTERFNPAVRAVAAMEVTPRFMEVRRVSPMTFRSLDVGVVMDLMIHDLDIVLMLAKSPLTRVDAVGINVLGRHEDVANARLVFASGCVADITASRLALKTERKMRLFSEDAYVSLDYQSRGGVIIRKSANQEALDDARQRLAGGGDLSDLDYKKLVHVEELTMDLPEGEQDPLTAELGSFVGAVATGAKPAVDGEAGSAAVEAAERVVAAIHAHQWEGLGKL